MNENKDALVIGQKINNSYLDDMFDSVEAEAQATADFLDAMSGRIIKLETSLKNCHANFPFKLVVKAEEREDNLLIEERHKVFSSNIPYSCGVSWVSSVKYWSLSWGPIEAGSKTYRLLLMCEEQETCWLKVQVGDPHSYNFPSKIIFKKALLETDIGTRREYSVYMNKFLLEFGKNLKSCREPISEKETCQEPAPVNASYHEVVIKKAPGVEASPEEFSFQESEALKSVDKKDPIQKPASKNVHHQKISPKRFEKKNSLVEDLFKSSEELSFQDDLPF